MNPYYWLSVLCLLPAFFNAFSQQSMSTPLKLQTAIEIALKNSPQIKNAELQVKKSELSRAAAWEIQPAEFTYTYGQINSPMNDYYFDVQQHFGSILTHIKKSWMAKNQVNLYMADLEIQKHMLTAQVKSAYYFWWFQNEKLILAKEEAEYLSDIQRIAELKYNLGEIGEIEKLSAIARTAEIFNRINIFNDEMLIAENKLKQLLVTDTIIIPPSESLSIYKIEKQSDTSFYSPAIITDYYKHNHEVSKAAVKTERAHLFPGFCVGYFYQDIYPVKGLSGWYAGISIPLIAFSQSAKIRQAKLDAEIALNQLEFIEFSTAKTIENLIIELTKYFRQIEYYNQFGLQQADEILRNAELHFKKENIEYSDYIQHVSTAFEIKHAYLETINNYNQIAIQLEIYAN